MKRSRVSTPIMKTVLAILCAFLTVTNAFGLEVEKPSEVSIGDFTSALERIKTYEPPQSRDPLDVIASMVRNVSDKPAERKPFAAALAKLLGAQTSYACKDFVCRQLAIIGSESEVASVSPLLADEKYSDIARCALEGIGGHKSRAALRSSLAKTSGKTAIGIINSLAVLDDKKAIKPLSLLTTKSDAALANAAVSALGKIGGSDAEKVLKKLAASAKGDFLDGVDDAYLVCADKLVTQNKQSKALAIYKTVYARSACQPIRTMALRGIVGASGKDAAVLLVKVLTGKDEAMKLAAVSLSSEIKGGEATVALANALPKLSLELQVKLLETLGYRDDPAALPHVLSAATSADGLIRAAALKTLGDVGNASTVSFLAKAAAASEGDSSRAARESLYRIKDIAADAEIVKQLFSSDFKVRLELINAVAKRKIGAAVPALLSAADDQNEIIRRAAMKALRVVAEVSNLPTLIELLISAKTNEERAEAETTIVAVAQKKSSGPDASAPIRTVYPTIKDQANKLSLLRVLGDIGSNSSLALLRTAIADQDKSISKAAIQALAAWPTPSPLLILLQQTQISKDDSIRALALTGYIRMIGLDEHRDPAHAFSMYQDAMKRTSRLEDQRAVLAGLSNIRTRDSLKMAAVYLEGEHLKNEAAIAIANIACPKNAEDKGLRGSDVVGALKKAALNIADTHERKKVEDYLATMPEDEDGFVSMFNGKDLSGWRGGDFLAEDGNLVCHGHHGGGLTYTKSEFANFVMRFEVNLSPGANNGLNFRTDGAIWNEIQILDDAHPVFTNLHPYQVHGSIYGVAPAKRGFLKPAGEWNYEEVTADGSRIKVRLNGEVIVDIDLSTLDLDKCLDGTAHPGLRRTQGGIGWLGHLNGYEKEGRVMFRNIRIKTLP